MLTLYYGSGSSTYRVTGHGLSQEDWTKRCGLAVKLLKKRSKALAASLLERINFELRDGENDFGDEFFVLYREVSLDEYLEYEEYNQSKGHRSAFKEIAETFGELDVYVRFICAELVEDQYPAPVSTPRPKVTSQTVEKALVDAELMVKQWKPINAVDRVHTALHGYIKQVCSDAGICQEADSVSLTGAVKLLREQHPRFSQEGGPAGHSALIMRSFSAICDTLNQIRNGASLAHPNGQLLDDAEAMLAVNAARTVLHYVHSKLQS